MSLMCDPISVTLATLTSSTISDSSTLWTYALQPAANTIYLDPVTLHQFKSLAAAISSASISFTEATNLVNWTAHGRANGDVFAYTLSGGATSPAGLSPSTGYYIVNAGTNDFQISLTPDGDPINFTTDGTGTRVGYINAPFDDAARWQDRGVPNRYLMFVPTNKAGSTFTTSCQVVVAPSSRIDTVAALGMRNVSELYIASTGTLTSHTNLVLRSRDFGNAAWTKTAATVTSDAIRGPDGALSADKLTGTAANGLHTLTQTITGTGVRYASIYVKAAELTKGWLAFGAAVICYFDLADGTAFLNFGVGSGDCGIERVNNLGWYRVWVSATSITSADMVIGLRDASGLPSFAGSTTQGFYIDLAQYEASGVTPPITTTTATVTTSTHLYMEAYDLTDGSHEFRQASVYPRTRYRRDVADSEVPAWASQSITVTLVSPGTGRIVGLDFALSEDIGAAEYDSEVGLRSASKTEPDEFNNINPIIRPSAKRGDWGIVLPEEGADVIKSLIDDADGLRKLWLMAPDGPEDTGFQWKQRGIISGLGKAARFKFFKPSHDKLALQIEGY